MQKVLPNLISSQQTAYIAQRNINESGTLIFDLLSVTKKMKVKGYLVTIDIEKAFDSLDHAFLISEQESCIINAGITTKYFKLGARQDDPKSACLFILCLEILFLLIKNNKNIKDLKMFDNTFLYTAYADDRTFFSKDKNLIKELRDTINYFSSFTGLKANLYIYAKWLG